MNRRWRLLQGTCLILILPLVAACGASREATAPVVGTVVVESRTTVTPVIRTAVPTRVLPTGTPTPTSTPVPVPTPVGRVAHIADLLAQGEVEVETRGAGIDELELDIRSLVDEALNVEIPAGTYFVAHSASVQNMVVRQTEFVHLADNDWVDVLLDVACANLERDAPASEDTFTITRSPHQGVLTLLMPVLEAAGVAYDVQQAAVWIVTDNAEYEALGTLVGGFAFSRSRVIGFDDAARAMQIVDRAGIDITRRAIWRDRQMIAVGTEDESLAAWIRDREQGRPAQAIEIGGGARAMLVHGFGILDFAFSPDGRRIATSACTGGAPDDCTAAQIQFWDADSFEPLYASTESPTWHHRPEFSPDGSLLASATCVTQEDLDCVESEIWLWDVTSGEVAQVLAGHDERIYDLAFSPDGQLLAAKTCAARENRRCLQSAIWIWDVATAAVARTLSGFVYQVHTMQFSPDGRWLVSPACVVEDEDAVCLASEIWFWDAATGGVGQRLWPDGRWVWSLAFTGDGRFLPAIGSDAVDEGWKYYLQVWDLELGEVAGYTDLPDDWQWCRELSVPSEGAEVAAATCRWDDEGNVIETEIRLWDLRTGETIASSPVLAHAVSELALSPDGQTVATLDQFGTGGLLLWDAPR